jgi:hypothetical protein
MTATSAQRAVRSVWAMMSSGSPKRPACQPVGSWPATKRLKLTDLGIEFNEPLARLGRPAVDVIALLALEALGVLGRGLDRLEVVVELDLLVEGLLLGVVAVEELGLDEADA